MDINYLKSLIKTRMGEYRYIHSVNVSKKAVELAKKYATSDDAAFINGILGAYIRSGDLHVVSGD